MKKISGIICEFNPLHEGHRYIIREAKKISEALVCIMSGNFVQRGECAVSDKYSRAKEALDAGADLVVSLPFPWCASPAEFFAKGGVTIACALGVTDLVFGSECGDERLIKTAAQVCCSEVFLREVETLYHDRVGYAQARYEAALRVSPEISEIFNSSNDTLAVEYVKKVLEIAPHINCTAVKRLSGYSASDIRASSGHRDSLFDIERTLLCLGKNSRSSFDHQCGIISRLEKCAASSQNGREMFSLAATKKYTDARLRRAALFSCLGVTKEHLSCASDHTVLLAANDAGRQILKSAREIEIVTKPADASTRQIDIERLADRLFTLASGMQTDADYFLKKSPYIG